MTTMQDFNTIVKIVKRAQDMHITIGSHVTQMMDIENAHKQFNLDLDAFLAAGYGNFAHDFVGIQRNMNRVTCRVENFFVPRFARESEV